MKSLRLFGMLLLMTAMPLGFSSCGSDDEPEVEPTPEAYFKIEQQGYKVSSDAQTLDVRVQTNIKVTPKIQKEESWIHISNITSEDDNLIYRVSVDENTSSDERIGNIVFEQTGNAGSDLPSNTVVITQAGATP